MKKIILLLFPIFLSLSASAEKKNEAGSTIRGYGGPVFYLQSFHGGYGLFFGGKGGAILNEQLSFGGTGPGSFGPEFYATAGFIPSLHLG